MTLANKVLENFGVHEVSQDWVNARIDNGVRSRQDLLNKQMTDDKIRQKTTGFGFKGTLTKTRKQLRNIKKLASVPRKQVDGKYVKGDLKDVDKTLRQEAGQAVKRLTRDKSGKVRQNETPTFPKGRKFGKNKEHTDYGTLFRGAAYGNALDRARKFTVRYDDPESDQKLHTAGKTAQRKHAQGGIDAYTGHDWRFKGIMGKKSIPSKIEKEGEKFRKETMSKAGAKPETRLRVNKALSSLNKSFGKNKKDTEEKVKLARREETRKRKVSTFVERPDVDKSSQIKTADQKKQLLTRVPPVQQEKPALVRSSSSNGYDAAAYNLKGSDWWKTADSTQKLKAIKDLKAKYNKSVSTLGKSANSGGEEGTTQLADKIQNAHFDKFHKAMKIDNYTPKSKDTDDTEDHTGKIQVAVGKGKTKWLTPDEFAQHQKTNRFNPDDNRMPSSYAGNNSVEVHHENLSSKILKTFEEIEIDINATSDNGKHSDQEDNDSPDDIAKAQRRSKSRFGEPAKGM